MCLSLVIAAAVTAVAASAGARGQPRCSAAAHRTGQRRAGRCHRQGQPVGHRASDSTTPGQLLFSNEFNGPAGAPPDPAIWGHDVGGTGWGNQELESYTPGTENAALDGHGDLAITARAETHTGPEGIARSYTSARLQTLHKLEFQYGLVQARIKVPAGQGLLGQFWALGNDGYRPGAWPASGEIDAMEVLGSEPDTLHGTLHAPWPWAPHGVAGIAVSSSPLSSAFHVYGVQWAPDRISFLLDGSIYQTITPSDLPPGAPWPFRHPYFLVLDLAVGGVWPGSPDTSTRFPATMLIDWVRVWR